MKYLLSLLVLSGCGCHEVSKVVGGTPGPQGLPGVNTVIEQSSASLVQCPAGGIILVSGIDNDVSGNISAGDSNIQSSIICSGINGTNGQNGQDAPIPAFTAVKAIAPCGVGSAPYKEVILLLADGSLLSSFSDNFAGQNTRLAFLPDGNYVNTDGSNCSFSVSTNGTTRTLSWSGGLESWGL